MLPHLFGDVPHARHHDIDGRTILRHPRGAGVPSVIRTKPGKASVFAHFLPLLLQSAAATTEDQNWFKHLQKTESDAQRALTPEEQALWVDMCRAKQRWNLILWYSLLAFHTTASTNELRGLRLGDISIPQELITIPWGSAKNRYRRRTISLIALLLVSFAGIAYTFSLPGNVAARRSQKLPELKPLKSREMRQLDALFGKALANKGKKKEPVSVPGAIPWRHWPLGGCSSSLTTDEALADRSNPIRRLAIAIKHIPANTGNTCLIVTVISSLLMLA